MKITLSCVRAIGLLGFAALTVSNAGAVIINFSTGAATTGSCFSFNNNGSCGIDGSTHQMAKTAAYQDQETKNTATLTWSDFAGSAESDGGQPTNIGYGTFQLRYFSNMGSTIPVAFGPATFFLKIQETGPVSTTYSTILVTVSGSDGKAGFVGPQSSSLEATFSPLLVSDGSTIFSIKPDAQLIVGATTNSGITTIQGQVVDTGVPEPGSMLLMGAGLLGLGWVTRRKFQA